MFEYIIFLHTDVIVNVTLTALVISGRPFMILLKRGI
jgi:hypothetical protein